MAADLGDSGMGNSDRTARSIRRPLTARDRVMWYVRLHPGRSAYVIAKALQLDPASTAAALHRLVTLGKLTRVKHLGPRGGFGYSPRNTTTTTR